MQQKSIVKPSFNISRNQNQGFFAPLKYLNGAASQTDYLDTSSSTTSVCLSQNDAHLQLNNNPVSFNPQSLLFRDTSQDGEVQADPRNSVPYRINTDSQLGIPLNPDPLLAKGITRLGKDIHNNFSSEGMITNYETQKMLNRNFHPQWFSSILAASLDERTEYLEDLNKHDLIFLELQNSQANTCKLIFWTDIIISLSWHQLFLVLNQTKQPWQLIHEYRTNNLELSVCIDLFNQSNSLLLHCFCSPH